jgi:hypothetical protein
VYMWIVYKLPVSFSPRSPFGPLRTDRHSQHPGQLQQAAGTHRTEHSRTSQQLSTHMNRLHGWHLRLQRRRWWWRRGRWRWGRRGRLGRRVCRLGLACLVLAGGCGGLAALCRLARLLCQGFEGMTCDAASGRACVAT